MKDIHKNLKKMSEEDLQWIYSHVTGKKTRDSKKDIINKKVLDFGCGYGEFANKISSHTKKTYVYEKSEICKKYIKKNFKKISVLNSLSDFDNFFDSFFNSDVLSSTFFSKFVFKYSNS